MRDDYTYMYYITGKTQSWVRELAHRGPFFCLVPRDIRPTCITHLPHGATCRWPWLWALQNRCFDGLYLLYLDIEWERESKHRGTWHRLVGWFLSVSSHGGTWYAPRTWYIQSWCTNDDIEPIRQTLAIIQCHERPKELGCRTSNIVGWITINMGMAYKTWTCNMTDWEGTSTI